MSGHKYTTVFLNEKEYRRLNEAQTRLRYLEKDLPGLMAEMTLMRNEAWQQNLQWAEERQDEFQNAMAGMDESIKTLEAETSRVILEQHEAIQHTFEDVTTQLWENSSGLIANQVDGLKDALQEQHHQHQVDLAAIQADLSDMHLDQRQRMEQADSWLKAAQRIYRFIIKTYDVEALSPGQTGRISRQIRLADDNLKQGICEAALVLAQQACGQLSDLRLEMEQRTGYWQSLKQVVLQSIHQLRQVAVHHQTVKAMDTAGKLLDMDIRVDEWSEGKLSRLMEALDQLASRIEADQDFPDESALELILSRTVPEFSQRLEKIIYQARLAVLNSQLRLNVADLVIQALTTQGYALQEGQFQGGNQKGAYTASMKSTDGQSVCISVDPVSGMPGKNEVHINSYDHLQRTEHELRQRSQEVTRALNRCGLQVGEMHSQPGPQPWGKPQKATTPIINRQAVS